MALAERATLTTQLVLDDKLTPGLAKAEASVGRLERQVGSASKGLTSAFSGIGQVAALGVAGFAAFKGVEIIGDSIKAASDLQESLSKSNVVFGQSAQAISAWGDTTAEALGISKQAAVEAAASFGNLFTGMGLSKGAAAGMSQDIVQLAADLASFNNIGTDEALQKIRSGLVGEAEPLRSVGVLLNEATVSAKAVELGFTRVNGVFTEAQKVQARYAIILEQTKTAQGDFARTSDGLANSQRIANAEIQDAMAKLGEALVPFAAKGAQAIATVAKAAADAVGDLEQFVDIVGDVVGAADKIRKENSDGLRIEPLAAAIDLVTGAWQAQMNTNSRWLSQAEQTSAVLNAQANQELPDVTRAHLLASEAVDDNEAAYHRLNDTVANNLGTFDGWTIASGNAGASLTILAATTATLADVTDDSTGALSAEAAALDRVAFSAAVAARNLAAVGTASIAADAANRARLRGLGETGGIVPGGLVGGGGPTVQPGVQNQDLIDQVAEAGRKAEEAARRAHSGKKGRDAADHAAADQAKKDASELAAANRDKVATSYDKAKQSSDRLFDSLHDRHIKAIKDAEDLAEKKHKDSLQDIEDTLKAAKAASARPVTEAQKRQDEIENARRRRDLLFSINQAQEALAKNRDPRQVADLQRSLQSAVESLQSFSAGNAIDRLKAAQALQDQAAENAAKIARDKADADLEAAKTKAAADEKFVNTRDAKRKQDFDTALAALRKRDEGSPAKFLTDLKQLQTKFGIFTDERGFTHIGDVVADAITKTKPPPVNVTLTVPRGAIQLNGRDVNNAATVGISPTQSQSARSGNARPRT